MKSNCNYQYFGILLGYLTVFKKAQYDFPPYCNNWKGWKTVLNVRTSPYIYLSSPNLCSQFLVLTFRIFYLFFTWLNDSYLFFVAQSRHKFVTAFNPQNVLSRLMTTTEIIKRSLPPTIRKSLRVLKGVQNIFLI